MSEGEPASLARAAVAPRIHDAAGVTAAAAYSMNIVSVTPPGSRLGFDLAG